MPLHAGRRAGRSANSARVFAASPGHQRKLREVINAAAGSRAEGSDARHRRGTRTLPGADGGVGDAGGFSHRLPGPAHLIAGHGDHPVVPSARACRTRSAVPTAVPSSREPSGNPRTQRGPRPRCVDRQNAVRFEITGMTSGQTRRRKARAARAVEAYFVRAFQNPMVRSAGGVPPRYADQLREGARRAPRGLHHAAHRCAAGASPARARQGGRRAKTLAELREPVRDYRNCRARGARRPCNGASCGTASTPACCSCPASARPRSRRNCCASATRYSGIFDGVLWANLGRQTRRQRGAACAGEALGIPAERMNNFDDKELWLRALQDAIGDRRMLVVPDDVWRTEDARRFMELGPRFVSSCPPRARRRWRRARRRRAGPGVGPAADASASCARDRPGRRRGGSDGRQGPARNPAGGLPLAIVLVGKVLRRAASEAHADPARLRRAYDEVAQAAAGSGCCVLKTSARWGGDRTVLRRVAQHLRRGDAATAQSIFRPKPNAFGRDIAPAGGGRRTDTGGHRRHRADGAGGHRNDDAPHHRRVRAPESPLQRLAGAG